MTYYDHPKSVADQINRLEMNCGVSGCNHQQRPLPGWSLEPKIEQQTPKPRQSFDRPTFIQDLFARLSNFTVLINGSPVRR